jgi:electron transfer flavoprotein beta subunit
LDASEFAARSGAGKLDTSASRHQYARPEVDALSSGDPGHRTVCETSRKVLRRVRFLRAVPRGDVVIQVVCIKQVPDTETRVKIAADGRSLDPAGVTWILNPYDEFAVEQALRVKEAAGAGEVIVVAAGPAGVQTTLRNVLAMGADRAIHLKSDAALADPSAVSHALAEAIRPLAPSLVWFGKQAVDDDAAQVGPMVSERLGLPCVTAIATFALDGERATVERGIEGGREVVEVTLPAAFTTDKGLNEPRYASLKGIMAAKKKPIEEQPFAAGEAGLDVVALELPAPRKAGRIVGQGVEAVPELVRLLREEAKVI